MKDHVISIKFYPEPSPDLEQILNWFGSSSYQQDIKQADHQPREKLGF